MMNILIELIRINRILSKRVKNNQYYYRLSVIFFSIVTLIFVGSLLLLKFIDIKNEDYLILFHSIMVFIFIIEIMLTLLRFQNKTLIEPTHLFIFPINRLKVIIFNILLLVFDLKITIFILTSFLFFFYFINNHNIIFALLSVIYFILFLVIVPTSFVSISIILKKILAKNRKNSILIAPLCIIILNGLIITDNLWICSKIPIINFLGNGLFALHQGDLK